MYQEIGVKYPNHGRARARARKPASAVESWRTCENVPEQLLCFATFVTYGLCPDL